MKKTLTLLTAVMVAATSFAQHILTYHTYAKDVDGYDTTFTQVVEYKGLLRITPVGDKVQNPIPGYSTAFTCVDYGQDSVFALLQYPDSSYCTAYRLTNSDLVFSIEGREKVLGYPCTKYKTIINSNTIEVWMTEKPDFEATPIPQYGHLKGVMVRCMRNGISVTDLRGMSNDKRAKASPIPSDKGKRLTSRELDNVRKRRLIIDIPVFEDEQINFDDYDIPTGEMPFDTTIHLSKGTVILKRLHLPSLPEHYQLFAEIRQRSNGDAYDRSASAFIIPTDKAKSLGDGLTKGIEALPVFKGRDGNEYQGVVADKDYSPPVEMVRFFTSFGAGHFNDKVAIDGLEWEEENHYKQEVSELRDMLRGDVMIGLFIGNYDKGGHKVSLNLLAYPNDYEWDDAPCRQHTIPLFNTCNVMEMSGQNYGRLFATDSLEVTFEIPQKAKNIRLRYISTGHGGWDNGDEFNPKENVIFIDGERRFCHTPWRCDCATYREQSPVSGNFWNGVSSSDYSRSGWCPGTATNPVFFELNDLNAGLHTIRIAIPQGKDEGGSFSHWMVSGAIVFETED